MARTEDKTKEIIEKLCAELQRAYRLRIESTGHKASGKLGDTLSYNVEYNGTGWVITLNMEKYWYWLEYGRKPGKMPPVEAIIKWLKVKRLLPRDKRGGLVRDKATGRFTRHNPVAWAIARKIGREGTQPTHLLEQTRTAFSFRNKITRAIVGRHRKMVEAAFSEIYNSNTK